MIKIISLLFLLLTTFHFNTISATTYYISNSGNDNNNGLSPVFPFKSLEKLNFVIKLLKPGDVILFERNGFFAGQIFLTVSGSNQLPIIFAAYGEGRNPVISGAVPIKNWSQYRENIYTSDVNYSVKNLFVAREQMILARYPNTGFLTIKSEVQNPKTGFIDNSLDQPKDYWTDANVRIRTTNWSYEHTPVKNFDNGRITFLNPTLYPVNKGWGYYLDNKLSELDAGKEWYYEDKGDSTGIVYFYAPANVNPNSVYTEGSIYSHGIFSNQNISNIIIRELKFMNQYEYGILFTGKSKSNIRIENCTFSGQIKGGVSILNPSYNCEIINCRFYNINGKALYLLKAENSKVTGNVIKNTGLIPGYGMNSEAQNNSSLIVMYSNSNIVSYNYILNTGHDGINCVGSNNIVEKNIIRYIMLKLNDGGGVKGYGHVNTNSTYRNNYISHIIGNSEGTTGPYSNIVVTGIYLDEHTNNMKVLNNTISESNNYGIFLYNNCNNNIISGNISYNNKVGINFFKAEPPMINNITEGNVFSGTKSDQVSVMLKSFTGLFVPGKFNKNYYINPLSDALFSFQSQGLINVYNFNQWQKLIGENNETNSVVLTGKETLYSRVYSNLSDDTLKEILTSEIGFKEINLNNVYGSLTLYPWTSQVIFANADISGNSEILTGGRSLKFGIDPAYGEPDALWFAVIGKNLTNPVNISAPAGFLVSTEEDNNFSKELTVHPGNKELNIVVFVKFVPEKSELYYDYISVKSGNLIKKVKVNGKK